MLLTPKELDVVYFIRKNLNNANSQEALEQMADMLEKTNTNAEFIEYMLKCIKVQKSN